MNEDEVGLANLVATEAGVAVPETPAPAEQTQTPEPQVPETNTPEPPVETPANEETPPEPVINEESQEPSKTETETTPEPIDWTQFLPQNTQPVEPPTPDEDGNIDPEAYKRYVIEEAKSELRAEGAARETVLQGVTAAEEVLPEMKTNPKVAQLVRDQVIAQAVNGGQADFVSAANTIKEIIGITKTEAANNVRTGIEIQKNAALETGSAAKASDASQGQKIADRINSGDEDAFVELIDLWQEQGVI